ncbi:MAG: hypothetical protein KKD05_10755 [Candidatus Omnitrophica bacterium]|nr:hypothetical protein [Candidatus Omnitrophota bacterium]
MKSNIILHDEIKVNALLILLGIAIILGWQTACYAKDLTLTLKFPQKSSVLLGKGQAISSPIEVSGNLTLSISPYPKKQCLVKYYLDGNLLYETEGTVDTTSLLDFTYTFNTTKFSNGKYKLYVNYWDKEGNSAIGSQKIFIINNQE